MQNSQTKHTCTTQLHTLKCQASQTRGILITSSHSYSNHNQCTRSYTQYHYTPIRLGKIKKNTILSVTEDMMEMEHSYTAHVKTKQFEQFKKLNILLACKQVLVQGESMYIVIPRFIQECSQELYLIARSWNHPKCSPMDLLLVMNGLARKLHSIFCHNLSGKRIREEYMYVCICVYLYNCIILYI